MPLSLVLDSVLGEPPNTVHPVVWIGRAISMLERAAPAEPVPALVYGALVTGLTVGGAAALGAVVSRVVARLPFPLDLLLESWTLKTTLSSRALIEAGKLLESRLYAGDLAGARQAATALVSRDVSGLTPVPYKKVSKKN